MSKVVEFKGKMGRDGKPVYTCKLCGVKVHTEQAGTEHAKLHQDDNMTNPEANR